MLPRVAANRNAGELRRTFHRSRFGYALGAAYIVAAVYFINSELRAAGGEINLRGLGVALATLPSQLTFGLLFESLGWRVNYSELGMTGYLQIGFHVLATAAVCYLIGYGIERLARRSNPSPRSGAEDVS
ncbi:MAG: hypothetical protein ACREVG_15710 [Burkholderiales bacterium]